MPHEAVEPPPRSVAEDTTDHGIVPRRERFVVWVLAVGALDFGLEQFMVVPILPAVQREEGASLTASAWLLTGFLLAAVAAAPVIGRLGDMYGRRRLLVVSVGRSLRARLLAPPRTR